MRRIYKEMNDSLTKNGVEAFENLCECCSLLDNHLDLLLESDQDIRSLLNQVNIDSMGYSFEDVIEFVEDLREYGI